MQTKDLIFENMLRVLDALVENAKKLKELSVLSEEKVENLQQVQETLVDELCRLDSQVKSSQSKNEKRESEFLKHIHKKLTEFQHENEEFLGHLKHKLGLIYFSPPVKKE